MRYLKPWRAFEEQADLLIDERGLVADRDELIERLSDVGYYRLSGYWYIFKRRDPDNGARVDRFIEGTTLEHIWRLYTFDRQFRLVVMDAIERVEVFFRTNLAYELARDTGAFGYLEPRNLPRFKQRDYDKFLSRCRDEFDRSREPFALHFREVYGDAHDLPPYWILVNLMDFGTMSSLYRGAPPNIRGRLAGSLGISTRVLDSWLLTLNTVRNICAHHGRLWNRGVGTRPLIPRRENDARWHEPFEVRSDRMFGVLTILSYLLERIAPTTSWRKRLFDLMDHFEIGPSDRRRMGFDDGWDECPFWKEWLELNGFEEEGL